MHVAITGASSGIGEALAREYAGGGAVLSLVARRESLLQALARQLPGEPCVCVQDLSKAAEATGWLAQAERAHGPIDILINNAGTQDAGNAAEMDIEVATSLLELNLMSPLRITHAVLPGMVARGHGAIVNVTSVAALISPPMQATYAASKAGLASFSEALYLELRAKGVHVLTVYPGPVKTPLADIAYAAYGGRGGVMGMLPEGRPDELAQRIRRSVEQRRSRLIYPRAYSATRWAPWLTQWGLGFAPLPNLSKRTS